MGKHGIGWLVALALCFAGGASGGGLEVVLSSSTAIQAWGYSVGVYGIANYPQLGYSRIGVRGTGQWSTWNHGVWGEATADNWPGRAAYGVYGVAYCANSGLACSKYGVYASGDLVWTGNAYKVSDLALKEAVAPLEGALPALLDLQAVTYRHPETPESARMSLASGPQVGFIAQQVAEVLPDLVREVTHPRSEVPGDLSAPGADVGTAGDAEPTRYLALKQIDLIPYLVRALQEQQQQIEALRAELAPLRTRLARSERTVTGVTSREASP